MFATFVSWTFAALIAGELLLFFVLFTVNKVATVPRRWGYAPVAFLFAVSVLLFIMSAVSLRAYIDTVARVKHLEQSNDRGDSVVRVMGGMKDMETSQRGFLLTHDHAYLDTYYPVRERIMNGWCDELLAAYAGHHDYNKADAFCKAVRGKTVELDATITLAKAGEWDRAMARIKTGEGKNLMDVARAAATDLAGHADAENRASLENLRTVAVARAWLALIVVVGSVIQMLVTALVLRVRGVGAVLGHPPTDVHPHLTADQLAGEVRGDIRRAVEEARHTTGSGVHKQPVIPPHPPPLGSQ